MEFRKNHASKGSPLPLDYLKMIADVFAANFEAGLKAVKKLEPKSKPKFKAFGMIYSNEIVLAISLGVGDEQLANTTVYASSDFDPKASAPTAEELLGASVDAIGSVFSYIFDDSKTDRIKQLLAESLASLDDIPFHWTKMEVGKLEVHLKVDKSNPELDEMADEWLKKNDPDLKDLDQQNERDAEKLFVTGKPKKPLH